MEGGINNLLLYLGCPEKDKIKLFVMEGGINNLLLYLGCPENNGKNDLKNKRIYSYIRFTFRLNAAKNTNISENASN